MPYRVYQACGNVDYLWNDVLLATDKGAESPAIHFGVLSVGAAANFVTAMQKSHPDLDLCFCCTLHVEETFQAKSLREV